MLSFSQVLPCYRGVESLNAAAVKVWESLGYQVHPVDCTATYTHFGCLHCLVNILKRTQLQGGSGGATISMRAGPFVFERDTACNVRSG